MTRTLIVVIASACCYAASAWAQADGAHSGIKGALTIERKEELCESGRVPSGVLATEMAKLFDLDIFELNKHRKALGIQEAKEPEVLVGYWLKSDDDIAEQSKLIQTMKSNVFDAKTDLSAYLRDSLDNLSGDDEEEFYVVSRDPSIKTPEFDADLNEVLLKDLFTGNKEDSTLLEIRCRSGGQIAAQDDQITEVLPDTRPTGLAVRKTIDDLGSAGEEAFKKLGNATVSYSDDKEKGVEATNIDIVAGYAVPVSEETTLIPFLAYQNTDSNSSDKDASDADKEVNAVKPGLVVSIPFEWVREGSGDDGDIALTGTGGLTAYYVHDYAQDSDSAVLRVFSNDLVLGIDDSRLFSDVCGHPRSEWSGDTIWFSCKIDAFAELGHVFDAGTNNDFETQEDDEYIGLGTRVGFFMGFPQGSPLQPFTTSVSYRFMEVVSGSLSNPSRYEASILYKIPGSNVDIGFVYQKGENSDTFVDEETLNFSAGWKY